MTKELLIISIILCISVVIFSIVVYKKIIVLKQTEQKEKELINKINFLNHQQQKKTKDLQTIKDTIAASKSQITYINNVINDKQKQHNKLIKQVAQMKKQSNQFYNQQKKIIEKQLDQFKNITSKAAENYFANLEKAYEHAGAVHMEKMTNLKTEQDKAAADLEKLKETRKAAYEASLRAAQVKQNKDNYRLQPFYQDMNDIRLLEKVKQQISKPRILSMLIWQTYWQPLAKKQFPIILKDKTKIGIYKITNLLNDQCYIGQSTDVYTRWCAHCKAGLGIDTPVGNKLYQAMLQDGLQNFTFELLCECPRQELNQKEAYFISLYQADTFGYNSTIGNKKQ